MLFVASDVAAADDADFNAWYDREHVEERARVEGFISAARYQAVKGGKRYLGLYRTRSLAAFTSPAYKAAFGQQTAWSLANLDRMVAPMRRVCAVTAAMGQGSGSWLSALPLESAMAPEALAQQILTLGQRLAVQPGFVHSYLLTPDAALSSPLPQEAIEGRRLLPLLVIESSGAEANETFFSEAMQSLPCETRDATCYALKWKLFSHELAG
jgi:hypothetical protein